MKGNQRKHLGQLYRKTWGKSSTSYSIILDSLFSDQGVRSPGSQTARTTKEKSGNAWVARGPRTRLGDLVCGLRLYMSDGKNIEKYNRNMGTYITDDDSIGVYTFFFPYCFMKTTPLFHVHFPSQIGPKTCWNNGLFVRNRFLPNIFRCSHVLKYW